MSFINRVLEYTITLGSGEFGNTQASAVVLTGHRSSVNISAYGGEAQGEMQCKIFGLSLDIINQLTNIGPIMTQIKGQNRIEVKAGDENGTLSRVYEGAIWQAWGDFNSSPDAGLNIVAYASIDLSLRPADSISYENSVAVADAMQQIATNAGIGFVNNGVTTVLADSHFSGSATDQIRSCAKAGDILYTIENKTLYIWPRTGARASDIPIISPGNGMVGYPTFSSQGLLLSCEFVPTAIIGGKITVQNSSIPMANGTWGILNVSHNLSAELPNGPWFTNVEVWNRD